MCVTMVFIWVGLVLLIMVSCAEAPYSNKRSRLRGGVVSSSGRPVCSHKTHMSCKTMFSEVVEMGLGPDVTLKTLMMSPVHSPLLTQWDATPP